MRATTGDFFLGMDDGEQRDRERQAALKALSACETKPIRKIALDASEAIVEEVCKRGGPIDVVKDLADEVPVRVAKEYYGVPNPTARLLLEWNQLTSWYIFNPLANEGDRERAERAGANLADHVGRLVRQRRMETPMDDLRTTTAPSSDAIERSICRLRFLVVRNQLNPPAASLNR